MRSTTLLRFSIALALLGGCDGALDVGVNDGALVVTNHCSLTGGGTLSGDDLAGAIWDESGTRMGSWSHDTAAGDEFVGAPSIELRCEVNGASLAFVRGTGTWNGAAGHSFRLHVQDRGTSVSTRVPGFADTARITATRYYSPSRWEDGAVSFAEGADVTVPASLPVTVGNGGNQWARLTFVEWDTGDAIRCSYRGGASTANPSRPADVAAGTRYDFVRCERIDDGCWSDDDTVGVGSVIDAGSVELHVQHGSSRHPSRDAAQTTIALDLAVTPYVVVTTEQDYYRFEVFSPAGPLVYAIDGDIDAGDLAITLL